MKIQGKKFLKEEKDIYYHYLLFVVFFYIFFGPNDLKKITKEKKNNFA